MITEKFLPMLLLVMILTLSIQSQAFSATMNVIDSIAWVNSALRIQSKKPLDLHTFSLKHPSRFVIDAPHTHLERQAIKPIKNNLISSIRHAEHHGQLRLVLDLKKPVTINLAHHHQNNQFFLLIHFKLPSAIREQFYLATNLKKKNLTSQSQKKRGRKIIVVIDPGHGGKDPGATGVHGIYEKKIVFNIAKILSEKLNRQPCFKAVLTRHGDYYLTLRQRLAVARKLNADLFVAIHADAYANRHAHGASVYALSLRGATNEAARWLAKKENASERMGGVDLENKSVMLKSVLLNLSQTAAVQASLRIGKKIVRSLSRIVSLHNETVEQAAFVVLKSPDIPSLLVETGFVSNVREARKLCSHSYQAQLADALRQGIQNYYMHDLFRGTCSAKQ